MVNQRVHKYCVKDVITYFTYFTLLSFTLYAMVKHSVHNESVKDVIYIVRHGQT